MTEPKRWKFVFDSDGCPVVVQRADGPWVETVDFDRVAGQRDKLAEALREVQWGEMGACCVCDGFLGRRPHADDCPVRAALAVLDADTQPEGGER